LAQKQKTKYALSGDFIFVHREIFAPRSVRKARDVVFFFHESSPIIGTGK